MESENYLKARDAYKELIRVSGLYYRHQRVLNNCPPSKRNKRGNLNNKEEKQQKLLTRCHVMRYNANSKWEVAVGKLTAEEVRKLHLEVYV